MNLARQTIIKSLWLVPLILWISACTSVDSRPLHSAHQLLDNAAVNTGNETFIGQLYESRTWIPSHALTVDTLEYAKRAEIDISSASSKLLGPSLNDSQQSLALKIWMIEQAKHTIDVAYYIYKTDLVGQAILGALCNAVKRGVDVRIMVDALGSHSFFHNDLRILQTCADDAGYIRDVYGQPTPYQARVQAVVINAMTSFSSRLNRRSHDKLLITDGAFPDKFLIITGGRNISLDYYGLNKDGSTDPTAYRDLELLISPSAKDSFKALSVGNTSEIYYTALFLHKGNKKLLPIARAPAHPSGLNTRTLNDKALNSLSALVNFPGMQKRLAGMADFVSTDLHDSQVLLAHELGNLTDKEVVTNALQNLEDNPNSIMRIIGEQSNSPETASETTRVVSPYMFLAKYYDKKGNVVFDDAVDIIEWLDNHPEGRIEIITNSVLTSDNFMAQSVIDMDMAPRMLLTPELQEQWLDSHGEMEESISNSPEWNTLVNHPQIFIYQTGKMDATIFEGGDRHYGKLHAKFIKGPKRGFIGTHNFDYRSRLFNNEMGFFYKSDQVSEELDHIFENLKASSYRWGSPEWIEMRRKMMEARGMKAWTIRHQRGIFRFMRATGLEWLI